MDVNHQAYFIHIWLNNHHSIALLFKKINSVPKKGATEQGPVPCILCKHSAGQ